jgi:hypothetical protein
MIKRIAKSRLLEMMYLNSRIIIAIKLFIF